MNLSANLRIARLDRRIIIQRATETRGATGGVTTTWAQVAEVSANVTYSTTKTGEEYAGTGSEAGFQQTAFNVARFTIRYPDGFTVTEKDRILYEGKYFDIRSIGEADYQRRRFTVIEGRKWD